MPNLNINELMRAILRIRNNLDKVEVKGYANQMLLVQAYGECESILKQLGTILDDISKAHYSESLKPVMKEDNQNDTDDDT